jgi:hypothetical protein
VRRGVPGDVRIDDEPFFATGDVLLLAARARARFE